MLLCHQIYEKNIKVKDNECEYEFLDWHDIRDHLTEYHQISVTVVNQIPQANCKKLIAD